MGKLNVLVVDDETSIVKMMEFFFSMKGCSIKTAQSAACGLELMEAENFDAAVVDINIPDMSGKDFILKAREIDPGIVCIIFTGDVDYVIPGELADAGITREHVLHKPVMDLNIIYDKIQELKERAES